MGDGQKVNGQARTILAVSAVLSALAILVVTLRFYIRVVKKASTLCKDDWLILAGLVRRMNLGPPRWSPILFLQICLHKIRP